MKKLKDKFVRNCVVWSASANCTFTVLEDGLRQRHNKLHSVQCLLTEASDKISVTDYELSAPLQ